MDVTPAAPAVEPGAAQMLLNGKSVAALITRVNNALVVTVGGVTATMSMIDADGNVLPLDANGNLVLSPGDSLKIETLGFGAKSVVEEWLFSTPIKLASLSVDAAGVLKSTVQVPSDLEMGDHRIVLKGFGIDGKPLTLAIGVVSTAEVPASNVRVILIAVPLTLALLGGLILPAISWQRRRRRA